MKLNFNSLIIFLATIVFALTAYFSVGYFHADEHYQVIEFAGLKAGWNTPQEVAWEYHTQIRSALLPTLAYWIFSFNSFFHITDPYTSLFVLRLISGFLCLFALVFFFRKSSIVIFKPEQSNSFFKATYLILLLLSWYIPFLSVRFSSETWSAICLLFALGFYFEIGKNKYNALIIGILFGLSFLFRFQMAFGLIGIGIYHLIYGQQKLKTTLSVLIGFSIVLLIGIFIDRWFYSEWVFTPWNYFWLFFENDILNNVESSFGTSSKYYYLEALVQLPTHFIGIVLLICFVIAVIFKPKNPVVWFIIPFVLIHSLIAHKEERFLFPIVFLFPFFIISAFLVMSQSTFLRKFFNPLVIYTIFALFFTHVVGLFFMTTKSAGLGRMEITQYIHSHYDTQKIHLINTPYSNPYNPWGSLPEKMYLEKKIDFQQIDNLANFSDTLFQTKSINLLVVRGYYLENNKLPKNIDKMGLKLIAQSISKKEQSMNRYVKGFENADVLYLYEWKRHNTSTTKRSRTHVNE
ncbi:mannosyltransferase [Fluviicola taffensis]|uniref:Alg9 family protein mannosyltransferase n=1 Tax=Fluviicola taffensis (strain DSM 16823 / NCIMB 13979 / RW262) TaxID=755732 RepID=F2ICN1_FLUTR|nr:mannosyltransferase [Fluviicola taffensis]AEA42258.1 Alg9 family protein mannosyltransferase [Fluviicola taffensis DSM 16823]